MTDRERLLDELRPVSFAIAYRMLGSVSEAEDIVHEALLRFHRALEEGEQVSSPRAFVATVTTRLAINELRSARARRERYVGEWLPEPMVIDPSDDPAQIAEIIGKSDDNVRQLATRARRHVEQRRPRFQTTREQRDELTEQFFAAAEHGDLEGLEALLAHDVVLTADGGGKVPALARSVRGRNRVARMLMNRFKLVASIPGVQMRRAEINGGAGLTTARGRAVADQHVRSTRGVSTCQPSTKQPSDAFPTP
jgi:DNA-directed RNA polymerase specialized sigma24 family protein/ketosteroid isomerase-like protein